MTDDEYDPDCNSREEYWERINIMADAIEDHYEPGDELPELVFEEVDQSRFAMMHHEAIQALRFSGEGPHEWKHFVSDDDSWRQVICAMAFDAVRNDLWAEIHDRGIDQ